MKACHFCLYMVRSLQFSYALMHTDTDMCMHTQASTRPNVDRECVLDNKAHQPPEKQKKWCLSATSPTPLNLRETLKSECQQQLTNNFSWLHSNYQPRWNCLWVIKGSFLDRTFLVILTTQKKTVPLCLNSTLVSVLLQTLVDFLRTYPWEWPSCHSRPDQSTG